MTGRGREREGARKEAPGNQTSLGHRSPLARQVTSSVAKTASHPPSYPSLQSLYGHFF